MHTPQAVRAIGYLGPDMPLNLRVIDDLRGVPLVAYEKTPALDTLVCDQDPSWPHSIAVLDSSMFEDNLTRVAETMPGKVVVFLRDKCTTPLRYPTNDALVFCTNKNFQPGQLARVFTKLLMPFQEKFTPLNSSPRVEDLYLGPDDMLKHKNKPVSLHDFFPWERRAVLQLMRQKNDAVPDLPLHIALHESGVYKRFSLQKPDSESVLCHLEKNARNIADKFREATMNCFTIGCTRDEDRKFSGYEILPIQRCILAQ